MSVFCWCDQQPTPNVDRSGVFDMDTFASQRILLLQFLGTLPFIRPGLLLDLGNLTGPRINRVAVSFPIHHSHFTDVHNASPRHSSTRTRRLHSEPDR